MIRILFIILLIHSSCYAQQQVCRNEEEKNAKDSFSFPEIQPGMELKYSVFKKSEEGNWEHDNNCVLIRETEPYLVFDNILFHNIFTRVLCILPLIEIDSSSTFTTQFNGPTHILKGSTAIRVSTKSFLEIKKSDATLLTIDDSPLEFKVKSHSEKTIRWNGKTARFKTIVLVSSGENPTTIEIADDENFPIIVRMDGESKLDLYEIGTVIPTESVQSISGEDLEHLLGKTMFDPKIFQLIHRCKMEYGVVPFMKVLNRSEADSTIELDFQLESCGYSFAFLNDTLEVYSLYNYTTKYDYPGPGKYPYALPFHLTFDMRQSDVKKLFGKPEESLQDNRVWLYNKNKLRFIFYPNNGQESEIESITVFR